MQRADGAEFAGGVVATVRCRRCFALVAKEQTGYSASFLGGHARICVGAAETACSQRTAALGRGARRKRTRAGSDVEEDEEAEVGWVACTRWFHTACVSVSPSADDKWVCEECMAALPEEDCDVL